MSSKYCQITLIIHDGIVRSGLEKLLTDIPMVASIDSGTSLADIPPNLDEEPQEVLFLSSTDPGWTETLREALGQRAPKVLLVLPEPTTLSQPEEIAGIDGLLIQRQINRSSLERALTQVVNGEVTLPPSIARQLLANTARSERPRRVRPHALTDRERQTLRLLADGLSNKQIGRRLEISEHGAKRLVANVLIKLDSFNRTNAVATAMQEGLL